MDWLMLFACVSAVAAVTFALPTPDFTSDVQLPKSPKFNPDTQIIYHLFTRLNPTTSQPLVLQNGELFGTNYNAQRRTIVLIHGWMETTDSVLYSVLVPAFLEAEDVNVIAIDWTAAGVIVDYIAALRNTPDAGRAVARFLTALNVATGSVAARYHIVGHCLGAHMAGIVGRNMGGEIAYITALDPANLGWLLNEERLHEDDAVYTEVVHTNAGLHGYLFPLGDVDFYPNGGVDMPGCISQECDQLRSIHYFGESITRGGFTGTRCASYITAMAGSCILRGKLKMGGLEPKTGVTGIFHLSTNWWPPFSRG